MDATAAGQSVGRDLAVGCFASIGRRRLGEAMLEFATRFPEIGLGVHEMTRMQLLPAMAKDELALALVPGEIRADFPSLRLWRDRVMVAMSAEHRLADRESVTPEELRSELLLISRQEHGGEVHRFLSRCVVPEGPAMGGLLLDLAPAVLMRGVARGQGVALVCASQSDMIGPEVTLRPLDAPGASFFVHGYWKRSKPDWPLATLIALLRETGQSA